MSEAALTSSVNVTTPAKAWLRALERTARIARDPSRIFPTVIDELAETSGDAPALLSDTTCWTFRQLAEESNRYARWALNRGVGKGDIVCLLMPNRPEYVAIWLGITQIGGVVALLNTNLIGTSLAHCIQVAGPKHIIVAAEIADALRTALPFVARPVQVSIAEDIQLQTTPEGLPDRAPSVNIHDTALYIYTSGTTGLPKAARISHLRGMQWSHWFAGMIDIQPEDRMYNCLPMYHSVGGIIATCAVLVSGGSVVVRKSFSVRQFWDDIVRWDCTLFQYIGELCRYLVNAEPSVNDTRHRIRLCCGNGLRPDVWNNFKQRFCIPRILEFYASTEGNISLYNVEGKSGAIGRIPSFLRHRFPAALVKVDSETNEPLRDQRGFCICCEPNEVGEAIGRIADSGSNIGSRFEGYTNEEATEKKILHNVFEHGDAWFRSGDLLRNDEEGFFYFVDRIGDTFRWKGENVASSEVSDAICAFPGVEQACVYGVTVPGAEGRAGMAAIVTKSDLDFAALRKQLEVNLPDYARPLFLRIRDALQVTATFKQTKNQLVLEGYDPSRTSDRIYFDHPQAMAFVSLDAALFKCIQAGEIRL